MKITNKEIIQMFNSLDSLSNKELPILTAYKMIDNLERLMKVYTVYDKARIKAKDEDEIKTLLDLECEVELIPLDKQELIDAGLTLTPVQLVGIRRLLDG